MKGQGNFVHINHITHSTPFLSSLSTANLSARGGPAGFASFFFGVGIPPGAARFAQGRTPGRTITSSDFEDSDDDDDDGSPLSGFFRAMHNGRVANASLGVPPPFATTHYRRRTTTTTRTTTRSTRSYARNANDVTAGTTENPYILEDSSDDEIEIVEVSHRR